MNTNYNTQLFSSYKKGEDRVTGSIIAVLERLNLSLFQQLIQNLLELSELDLVKFENQFSDGNSRVDARVSAKFDIVFEVKTVTNAYENNQSNKKQLLRHYNRLLERSADVRKLLIVLTPDAESSVEINSLLGNNYSNIVKFISFQKLYSTLETLIEDFKDWVSAYEFRLIMELLELILKEDLLPEDIEDRVLVIPAGDAFDYYKKHHVYRCQPNRSFRKSPHLSFYSNNRIYKYVPKILASSESVNLDEDNLDELEIDIIDENYSREQAIDRFKELKGNILQEHHGGINKFLILSRPEDEGTLTLNHVIINNKLSKSGTRTAFVQNQGYVSLEKLKHAEKTSDLISE